jgi:hypothetical protein
MASLSCLNYGRDLKKSRAILAKVDQLMRRSREEARKDLLAMPDRFRQVEVNEALKKSFLATYEKGLPVNVAALDRIWEAEFAYRDRLTELIDVEMAEGRWKVVNGEMRFDRAEDGAQFQAKMRELRKLLDEQAAKSEMRKGQR